MLLLIAAGVALKLTAFKAPAKGAESGNTGSQATKGEPLNPPATSSTNSNGSAPPGSSSQPGDQKNDTGISNSTNATLVDPTGQFISNHAPGQNGSPDTITSVCNTTPGATCQITFTKEGVTKSLPIQTTDRGGSAYWNNWKPADYGLSTGSWNVQAVAKLNGQTKTASDAIPLVIK